MKKLLLISALLALVLSAANAGTFSGNNTFASPGTFTIQSGVALQGTWVWATGSTMDVSLATKIGFPSGGTGGTPGGTNTQMQFNNLSAFGGVPWLTYSTTTGNVSATSTHWKLVDPSSTKQVTFSTSTLTNDHTVTYPDGDSVTVQPDFGATHQWVTGITPAGFITKSQPAFTDITGVVTNPQMPPNITGKTFSTSTFDDTNTVTVKDGSFTLENTANTNRKAVFDLTNISSGVTRTVNVPDAFSTTVQTLTASGSNFLTGMSAQGIFTLRQPAFTDVSGATTNAQLPPTISGKTFTTSTLDDSNTATFKDSSLTLENAANTTKKAAFNLSNVAVGTTASVNVPNGTSTAVVTGAASVGAPPVANSFVTGITASGQIQVAQPDMTNLSGSITTSQGGIPPGGTTNQVLSKIDGSNYNTHWITPVSGGGGGTINSIVDPTDPTKQLVFDIHLFPTATTFTLTPASANSVTVVPLALGTVTTGTPTMPMVCKGVNGAGTIAFGYPDSVANTLAGDKTDWNLNNSTQPYQRWNATATRNINSLALGQGATSGDGMTFWITNTGSFALTIKNESATGTTAANKFHSATGADIVLVQDAQALVQYDSTIQRWRAYPIGASGGTGSVVLTGDVTGSGTGTIATTIGNNVINYGKLQTTSVASKLIGSPSTGTAIGEITLGTGLSMSGSTLNAAGIGGGGTPGGSDQQLQFNNAGAFGGIPGVTYNAGAPLLTLKVGNNTNFVDPVSGGKIAQIDVSNLTPLSIRTVNIPDANSTTAQAKFVTASQWINAMSAQGVFTSSQPAFTDITGAATSAQLPNPIQSKTIDDTNTILVKDSQLTIEQTAAPSKTVVFNLVNVSTSGQIRPANGTSVTVTPDLGAANNFLTGIGNSGAITKAQPTIANLAALSGASKLLGSGSTGGFGISEITLGSGLSMAGTTLSVSAGGGNVSSVGTPTGGQMAQWTGASTIQGVGTTGSGNAVMDTSPTILTPTIAALANLTTNGFVKTGGGSGTLSVDTNTYITGNQTITLSGDVTGTGSTAISNTISNKAVTLGKVADFSAASKLLGSGASAVTAAEITLGTNLSMSGNTLNAAGGGGGTPGGSTSQLQYNNSGAFGGISTATTDGTIVTHQAGSNFVLADPTDTTKKATFDLSAFTTATTRSIKPANQANLVIPAAISNVSHQFLNALSTNGLFAAGRPQITDLTDLSAASKLVGSASTAPGVAEITLGTGLSMSGSTLNMANQTITLSGDVTGSGATAITSTIANNAVTYAKMQAAGATSRLIGAGASSTALGEITLGTNLSMSGTTLNATGGGGGTPGGADKQVQFNDGGSTFGTDSDIQWDKTANTLTLNNAPAANTVANQLMLQDTVASSATNFQYSPSLRFKGTGWASGAGASHTSEWRIYNKTKEDTSNSNLASGDLTFGFSENGGTFTDEIVFGNRSGSGHITTAGNDWRLATGAWTLASPVILGWSTGGGTGTADVGIDRVSSATLETTNGTAGQYGIMRAYGWLPAGTTSQVPLLFNSGTNSTTATAGAMEYDGKLHYSTHAAGERGVLTSEQWIRLTSPFTLPSVGANTLTPMFNSTTNGRLTLAGNTTYHFKTQFSVTGIGSTSGVVGWGMITTGTITNVQWRSLGVKANSFTASGTLAIALGSSFASTAYTPANTSTGSWGEIDGEFQCGSGGCTIIPAFSQQNASITTTVVGTGATFHINPIGTDTQTSQGNWD